MRWYALVVVLEQLLDYHLGVFGSKWSRNMGFLISMHFNSMINKV